MQNNKISDLKFQEKNLNKCSQFGDSLLEKSISKFGFIEAGVLDKNGTIVSGNHRIAKAGEKGYEDVIIVKGDRNKAIMVQYDDIDIETPEGKELCLALNATAKANIVWDEEMLVETLEENVIEGWGVNIVEQAPNVDYSLLDDDDADSQLQDMANGVKKAIQIEFEPDHYQEAYQLVKFWRERNAYVGAMIIEYLKAEKDKL